MTADARLTRDGAARLLGTFHTREDASLEPRQIANMIQAAKREGVAEQVAAGGDAAALLDSLHRLERDEPGTFVRARFDGNVLRDVFFAFASQVRGRSPSSRDLLIQCSVLSSPSSATSSSPILRLDGALARARAPGRANARCSNRYNIPLNTFLVINGFAKNRHRHHRSGQPRP